MRLPGAERAVVDPAKVRGYLLSTGHPLGRSKARVFAAAGYRTRDWSRLVDDLTRAALSDAAVPGRASRFGRKYEIDCILRSPEGRDLNVRTVWIVRDGEDFPRLITAHPRGQR